MFGFITKILRKPLDTVLGQLTQQFDILDNAVRSPMQTMISEITSGVWVGQGADAFVEELTTLFIPGTEGLQSSITGMGQGINAALDLVDQADEKAQGIVGDIVGIFDAIF